MGYCTSGPHINCHLQLSIIFDADTCILLSTQATWRDLEDKPLESSGAADPGAKADFVRHLLSELLLGICNPELGFWFSAVHLTREQVGVIQTLNTS